MTSALPYWVALIYGAVGAAAVAVGGGLVGARSRDSHESHGILPAMGAGFLIALGAFSALPEALELGPSRALTVGIAVATFALVLVAHGVGHRRLTDHESEHGGGHAGLSLHDARLAVTGLALHSLLDGVAVSAALAERRELGLVVAAIVVLHKMPEGAAAAALVYASGGSPARVRRSVWLLAVTTALGALTIFAVGPLLGLALSLAAGVTTGVGVGIAGHLLKHRTRHALVGVVAGAMLFALSEFL